MLMHHLSPQTDPQPALRACAHDLRNLFAVVACAKSLLERPLDEQRRRIVMDGLARVAIEGKIVTDALLNGDSEDRSCGTEASSELQSLTTVIETLERPGLRIDVTVEDQASWILMPPSEFRAIVLELVTNAVAAGAGRINIRAGRKGCRFWLAVGDDGSGFVPEAQPTGGPAGLHGTGLRRLASAVASARGKVRIRSKPGSGSVIAMILPIIRIVANDEPGEILPSLRSAG